MPFLVTIAGILLFFLLIYFLNKEDNSQPDETPLENSSNKEDDKQPNETTFENSSNMDCYAKTIAAYQMIDNAWSWTKDHDLYTRSKLFESQIKEALHQCYTNMYRIPNYKKKEDVFDMFAMFQCFALSFVLVLRLESHFYSYESNEVTQTMAQVMAEEGYFDNNGVLSFESMDLMIANKEVICQKTLRKLPRRIIYD